MILSIPVTFSLEWQDRLHGNEWRSSTKDSVVSLSGLACRSCCAGYRDLYRYRGPPRRHSQDLAIAKARGPSGEGQAKVDPPPRQSVAGRGRSGTGAARGGQEPNGERDQQPAHVR